jgi:hypothetical protein
VRAAPSRAGPSVNLSSPDYRATLDRYCLTRDAASTVADLKKAETESLGVERFMLLNAAPFGPGSHDGHKMEAKGLLYREPGENRITLSSLQMLAPGCIH